MSATTPQGYGRVDRVTHPIHPYPLAPATASAESSANGGPAASQSALLVRALGPDDVPDIVELDGTAFGQDMPEEFLNEVVLPELELDRFIGVRDPAADDLLVAVACILTKPLTFPGGAVHPTAGVSWVGVRPGWRRRGLLRALITRQLHDLHDSGGEAIAILTASEAGLYGRFGYGRAIDRCRFTLTHRAAFRPDVQLDNVVDTPSAQANPIVRALYERVAPTRPGHLGRHDGIWSSRFSDHEIVRSGRSNVRFGLHPDGYVAYRVKPDWNDRGPNYAIQVEEICAATARAAASLWRFVLDLDLAREIVYNRGWIDDPLSTLLLDPRTASVSVHDHIWLRIVDLDRAIPLRTYSSPTRVVVALTDVTCPWNDGTWLLDLDLDGGTAVRTDADAQIAMDVRDLGACLLGGTPLARLAAAGIVTGDAAALTELGAALCTPTAPWCPEGF
jgi:predicted acetyltransferase